MFANLELNLTAQEALEITCEEAKKEELDVLHSIIKTNCSHFWETVQVRQEDYAVINVRKELIEAGVPFKENVQKSYDCDLTRANDADCWFYKVVSMRDHDIDIILSSVTSYIKNAAKNQHRNCVWGPDANHQGDYNWKWLIQVLQKKGFSACLNQEGDIMIDW